MGYTVEESGNKWVKVVNEAPEHRRFGVKHEVEQMFLGQYEHSVDEKGRMTIPARFREQLENGAYLTRWFDKNLVVFTADDFTQIFDHVNALSITDPAARALRRLIFSNAERVEFDRAGRILIPQFLREASEMENTAVVVGAGNYFEIWSDALWQKQNAQLEDSEAVANSFASLNLAFK